MLTSPEKLSIVTAVLSTNRARLGDNQFLQSVFVVLDINSSVGLPIAVLLQHHLDVLHG